MQKLAIICGGPSAERGISLNSARSLFDNIDKNKYAITLLYFNTQLQPYLLTEQQIYSNTPSDFDYKLGHGGKALTENELQTVLQGMDVVFPAIHGAYGEDGGLQTVLEAYGVRYVGSGPVACRNTSDKHLCQEILKHEGFFTLENYVYKKGEKFPELKPGKYVIKPLHGGSSLGVEYFHAPIENDAEFQEKLASVFHHEPEAIIEPFFVGTEFTIIVLENGKGEAVALPPTEVEFHSEEKFFSYRKKYLATAETRYHTPARFPQEMMEKIEREAERAFEVLGMRDFARLDGWIDEQGNIWLSDVNGISGMEQNSFLFQQAALIGLSHQQLLDYILEKKIYPPTKEQQEREALPIIFGGSTAERQVSVISGTNVWMKLKKSLVYKPVPLILSTQGKIYQIPQFLCLHHTVEEIEEKVHLFQNEEFLTQLRQVQEKLFGRLGISREDLQEDLFVPQETTLDEIKGKYKFLFLGLHGGDGENGVLQKKLEDMGLPFNGPGSEASKLCMDKYLSGQRILEAQIAGVSVAKKIVIELSSSAQEMWNKIVQNKIQLPLIIKPRGDGCSAGVVRINTEEQFHKTIEFFLNGSKYIPEKAIHDQHGQIDLPSEKIQELLVEDFIVTDKVLLKDMEIDWSPVTDYVEVTIGVLGPKGQLHVLNPSQTIASQEILSLEEKFMGGTGINLTPPPQPFVTVEAIEHARKNMKQVAECLGIEGYSRIDAFMHRKTGDLVVIEANTLPGLTPSTVLYHQGLAEQPSLNPLQLLEKIITIGKGRYTR